MDKTTSMIESAFSLHGLFTFIGIIVFVITFFYIIFAFLLTRQVKLLNKSFSSPLSDFFAIAVFIHLVLSAFVAFLTLISL